jgi:hypothetical protein
LGSTAYLEGILEVKIHSIRAMEEANRVRQRAPRRTPRKLKAHENN